MLLCKDGGADVDWLTDWFNRDFSHVLPVRQLSLAPLMLLCKDRSTFLHVLSVRQRASSRHRGEAGLFSDTPRGCHSNERPSPLNITAVPTTTQSSTRSILGSVCTTLCTLKKLMFETFSDKLFSKAAVDTVAASALRTRLPRKKLHGTSSVTRVAE